MQVQRRPGLTASVLLVAASLSSRHHFPRQAFAVFVAMAAPWDANGTYALGFAPGDFDVTTIASAVTALALAFPCVRWQLLDLAPVARNTLVERMRDGMVVPGGAAPRHRLRRRDGALMTCSTEDEIGQRAQEVLPADRDMYANKRGARPG